VYRLKGGDLYHPAAVHGLVDPAQFLRMDQVLGVVNDDDVEAHGALPLVLQHALIDPVEAIGLRCRAIVRAERQVDLLEAGLGLPNGGHSLMVVGISADEHAVIAVLHRAQVMLEHLADHAVLVPQGDENGGAFLRWRLARRHGRRLAPQAAEPGPEADQVEKKVVQAADQDPNGEPGQAGGDDPVHSRQRDGSPSGELVPRRGEKYRGVLLAISSQVHSTEASRPYSRDCRQAKPPQLSKLRAGAEPPC